MMTTPNKLQVSVHDLVHDQYNGPSTTSVNNNKITTMKSGTRKSMFWVSEKKLTMEERIAIPQGRHHERIWKTAGSYVGDWKDNLKHGFGIQIWPNGNKYEGEWSQGHRHGTGNYYRVDGDGRLVKVYSGEWRHDVKYGLGVYYYKNGKRYEGEWKNGIREGHGTEMNDNGDVYIGGWIQGKMSGWGRLISANGNEFIGEWLNGLKEGKGQYFYRDQDMVYEGEWVKGIAQCGVCGPIDSNTDQGSGVVDGQHHRRHLPKLEVQEPEQIIESRIIDVQLNRAATRGLSLVNIEDIFDGDAIADLHRLFDAALKENEHHEIGVLALLELLLETGLNPTPEDLARIISDFDKNANEGFSFVEFVKSIYLMQLIDRQKNGDEMKGEFDGVNDDNEE